MLSTVWQEKMLHNDNNENLLQQNENSRQKPMCAAMCQRQVSRPPLFDEIITAENY